MKPKQEEGSKMEWQADKWPDFTESEMRCRETGELEMSIHFMNRLQGLRRDFNQAMVVTSGYRSPNHSIEKNKANGPGSHAQGHACDIKCTVGAYRHRLVELAIKMGFSGIGVSKDFIHLDDMKTRDHAPRPSMWTY